MSRRSAREPRTATLGRSGQGTRRRYVVPFLAAVAAALTGVALIGDLATSTPLYSGRSGRACDTCHLDPGFWDNPVDISERKCTLSCQGCHVDPAGGGMRNASGRFYGAATLPMIATQPRPTMDWDRDFLGMFTRADKKTVYTDEFPRGPAKLADQHAEEFAPRDTWGWGTPAKGMGKYSLTQGRYGTLRADPMLRVGWDVRAAFLSDAGVFPMQLDLGLAFQPVEHFTLLLNVGARGRSEGVEAVFDDPSTPYLRDAFILLHEFPYQAYVKGGRFTPSYGLRLDDHTAFVRRRLDLDLSLPESRVTGIEVGANPNYPFIQASYFRSKAPNTPPEAFNPFDVDDSWGTAIHAGFRDEPWSLGASFIHRDYTGDGGTKTTAYGVYGVFNAWALWRGVPLTYQVELDRGTRDRFGDAGTAASHVLWQELTWTLGNGWTLLGGHTWEDPDREVGYDEANRLHAGVAVVPYPGVTLDLRVRGLLPRRDPDDPFLIPGAGAPEGADLFFQIHLWN